MYNKQLITTVRDLETKLQRSLDIINSYDVPVAKYNDVQRKITFVEEQVNNAIDNKVDERNILSTIEDTYLPFADRMYDHLRWYMNKLKTQSI